MRITKKMINDVRRNIVDCLCEKSTYSSKTCKDFDAKFQQNWISNSTYEQLLEIESWILNYEPVNDWGFNSTTQTWGYYEN